MVKRIQKERANAVLRYLAGEAPESICASLSKTTRWLYTWFHGMPMMILCGVKNILGDRFATPTARLLRQKISWRWFG